MGKCRIWYGKDGKVSISHPDTRLSKKPEGLTLDQWADIQLDQVAVKAPQFAGLEFDDMDTSALPQDRKDRDRWRGSKGKGVHIDHTVVLRQDIMAQLDAELAKDLPNTINAMRLQRKLDKREHN